MTERKDTDLKLLSRRRFAAAASVLASGSFVLQGSFARAAIVKTDLASLGPYGNGTVPAGIRSRNIDNVKQ